MSIPITKYLIFDYAGGPLQFNFNFKGAMKLDYYFKLYDSDQKTRIFTSATIDKDNSNINSYTLPLPPDSNIGRVLQLRCDFTGADEINFPDYSIQVELIQDGKSKGVAEDKGKLDGSLQDSLIIVTLI